VFKVFSAVEFNLAVRSLASFLKAHKNIGLIVVDGTHLIENVEIYSVKNSDKFPSSTVTGSAGKTGKKGAANVMAMAAQNEVPSTDDFFGATPQAIKATPTTSSAS
jgi:hypothetical protein